MKKCLGGWGDAGACAGGNAHALITNNQFPLDGLQAGRGGL